MQVAYVDEINSAATGWARITTLNQKFLANAKAYPEAPVIRSSLQILGDDLEINCFGYVARAKPRPVRASNDNFFMEYVFMVPFGERMIEVTRFYLTEDGLIQDYPNDKSFVCDFNNAQIAKHLCARALFGVLASPLLAPAEVQC